MRSAPSQRAPQPAVVLLVDDNHHGMLARQSVLEEFGYTVTTALCAADALDIIKGRHIDLMVTDFKMEPVGGLELIGSVRASHPTLPIILLTGFADKLGLDPGNTGASVVLQKNSNEVGALLRTAKRLLQPPRKPARSQAQTRAKAAGK